MSESNFDLGRATPEEIEQFTSARLAEGDAGTISEAVLSALVDAESWRRSRILNWLSEFGSADALLPSLAGALSHPTRADWRNASRSVLATLASPASSICEQALDQLDRMLSSSEDVDVRLLTASTIGESGNARGREPLIAALKDENTNVAASAAEALGMLGDRRAVPALIAAIEDAPFWVQASAVVALGRLADDRALESLQSTMEDPTLATVSAAAIGEIGAPRGLALLRPAFHAGGEAARTGLKAADRILAANSGVAIPGWLRRAAADRTSELVAWLGTPQELSGARLLGIAATPEAIEALLKMLEDEDRVPTAMVGLENLPDDTRAQLAGHIDDETSADAQRAILDLLPPLDDPATIADVARCLGSPDPAVRAAASEALGRSDEGEVFEALEAASADPSMRLGIAMTYGHLGKDRCLPLIDFLSDADPAVRSAAARSLGRCTWDDVAPLVDAYQRETNARVRQSLLSALGDSGSPDAVGPLAEALTDDEPSIRFSAARALGRIEAAETLSHLLGTLQDPVAEVRIAGLIALGDLGDPRATQAIGNFMREGDPDVRRTAARSLDHLARPDAWSQIADALDDPDREVRLTAVDTLRKLGDPAALDALSALMDREQEGRVRDAASRAIVDLRSAAENA